MVCYCITAPVVSKDLLKVGLITWTGKVAFLFNYRVSFFSQNDLGLF